MKYKKRVYTDHLVKTESLEPTFNDMIHPDDNRDASTSTPPSIDKKVIVKYNPQVEHTPWVT